MTDTAEPVTLANFTRDSLFAAIRAGQTPVLPTAAQADQAKWSARTQEIHDLMKMGLTVDQARAAHGSAPTTTTRSFSSVPQGSEVRPASEKQISFLTSLLRKVEPDTDPAPIIAQGSSVVSAKITELKSKLDAGVTVTVTVAPVESDRRPTTPFFDIPVSDDTGEAHYALPGKDGEVAFYTVRQVTKGNWAGWTFVEQHASDERYSVKGARRSQVLTDIAADPKAAAILYGRETNTCSRCGRELTQESSRKAGIGPRCASLLDW